MSRSILAAVLLAAALPSAAQSVPNANYSDMWLNPNESGWGLSFVQHASNFVYAVWYTYDPREPEPATANPADHKPLWIVMNGGSWSAPNRITGNAYVANGTHYAQPWNGGAWRLTPVGTFTFDFSDSSHGTFTYNITPPSGLDPADPAFGLPAMSGTKPIERQGF